jgi:hypothetical protein
MLQKLQTLQMPQMSKEDIAAARLLHSVDELLTSLKECCCWIAERCCCSCYCDADSMFKPVSKTLLLPKHAQLRSPYTDAVVVDGADMLLLLGYWSCWSATECRIADLVVEAAAKKHWRRSKLSLLKLQPEYWRHCWRGWCSATVATELLHSTVETWVTLKLKLLLPNGAATSAKVQAERWS